MRSSLLLTLLLLTPGLCQAGNFSPVDVQGHRGARWVRPENTLAAFQEALRLGVDVLEFDLNVTKDNVVVVTHDQSINPAICLGPDGKKLSKPVPVRSLTLEELKQYDCGTLKNPKFSQQQPSPGERIPTLDETLAYVARSGYPSAGSVHFNIETKIKKSRPELSPEPAEFVNLTLKVLHKYGVERRTIIESFDERTLVETKKQEPVILTARLMGNPLEVLTAASRTDADIISPYYKWLNKAIVGNLHKKGFRVIPWTVNKPSSWARMRRIGVDAILTDNPGGLIEYLAANPRALPGDDEAEAAADAAEAGADEAAALEEEY